ncbi:hypothetical protein AO262_27410 [Pseudomonas fluorescens ABAC62]|nr:hypothetical protein AO262_27410 [Pseudomonas fluorescens ABAC62]
MPYNSQPDSSTSVALEEVHIGYVPILPLDRLMALRNVLVALNGPLAGEAGLRENLQRQLLSDDSGNR